MTRNHLMELLDYDPATGQFRWRVDVGCKFKAGSLAGGIDAKGYTIIGIDKKLYKAHRLAWLYVYGVMPSRWIDHKDQNQSNNAIENLRLCTRSQNNANSKLRRNNPSGFKGVRKVGMRYQAGIRVDGKQIYLGTFSTASDASAVYACAAEKYFGEFHHIGGNA